MHTIIKTKEKRMVDSPNIGPTPESPQPVSGPGNTGSTPQQPGWNPKPLTWLGMSFDSAETKKLWQIISQNVNQQIQHEQAKAIEALRKLNPEKNPDL